jgi:hypothetical protein
MALPVLRIWLVLSSSRVGVDIQIQEPPCVYFDVLQMFSGSVQSAIAYVRSQSRPVASSRLKLKVLPPHDEAVQVDQQRRLAADITPVASLGDKLRSAAAAATKHG